LHQPFAIEPVGEPGLAEQLDGALLERPGPDPLLDGLATASLEHERIHAPSGEQM
jgi:hypothetical protein